MISNRSELLTVQGLCQSYQHFLVLKDLDFSLNFGEVVSMLGRNGSGKTTLLKVLAHLLKPIRGTITTHPVSLGISLFLPDGFLYEDLTLRENLDLYARLCGTDANWQEEIRTRLGLGDFMDNKVRNLSRGQKIRGALCRTFMQNASLYLLDEPFTGLDPTTMSRLAQLLVYLKSKEKTILLATHHIDSVLKITDSWWQMENGRLNSVANPSQLIEEWKQQ